jgi:hypothetical protein
MENGMNTIYYFAAWMDSGFLLGCDHEHQTVPEAVACISCTGGYVIAVENRVLRALTDDEEAEFQRASGKSPAPPVLHYDQSGYAVMVQVRFMDGWGWTTSMRFDTYEEAAAQAREGNKIVPFGSVEWSALRQCREPALPAPASAAKESAASRDEGETLVEFVSRLVPSPLDQQDQTDREIKFSAGSERRTLVELVSAWIKKWEVNVLERLFTLPVPVRIDALRKRLRKTLKHEARTP